MKRVFFLSLLLYTILVSCVNPKYEILNDLIIDRGSIKVISDTTTVPISEIINGEYKLDFKGKLYKKGVLSNSQNRGEWFYHINGTNNTSRDTIIIWRNYYSDNFDLCIPINWKGISIEDSTFIFSYDILPKGNRNLGDVNYIAGKRLQKKEKSLLGYNLYYANKIRSISEVQSSDHFSLKIDEIIIGYFNRFIIRNNGQNNFIVNYCFEDTMYVYDITLKTNSQDTEIIQLIFFELLRSLNVDNQSILPRKGYLEFHTL